MLLMARYLAHMPATPLVHCCRLVARAGLLDHQDLRLDQRQLCRVVSLAFARFTRSAILGNVGWDLPAKVLETALGRGPRQVPSGGKDPGAGIAASRQCLLVDARY